MPALLSFWWTFVAQCNQSLISLDCPWSYPRSLLYIAVKVVGSGAWVAAGVGLVGAKLCLLLREGGVKEC